MKPVRLTAAARAEFDTAVDVYEVRVPGLGRDFDAAVQRGLADIAANPGRYPRAGRRGYRRYTLGRFPYDLVYREDPALYVVVAVAHHKRRPGYWFPRA